MMCRHCGLCKASRPRGLCWTCYYSAGVREQYESLSKFGRRGPGNTYGRAPLPPFPTTALPGSPEKIAILEQRAAAHQELFHPLDATLDTRAELGRVG